MAKERRQANMSHSYDRLWSQKLTQAYRLLIDDDAFDNSSDLPIEPIKRKNDENSGYLCESVLRSAEGK